MSEGEIILRQKGGGMTNLDGHIKVKNLTPYLDPPHCLNWLILLIRGGLVEMRRIELLASALRTPRSPS